MMDTKQGVQSARTRSTFQLTNPSSTEIQLTIRCEDTTQLRHYAPWIKAQVESLKTIVQTFGNQEVRTQYDESFEGLKVA
jgi:hypothetical protein